jgi:serine/threonine protein kinase/formylglycine-generating enzyme required for sulfatase activity
MSESRLPDTESLGAEAIGHILRICERFEEQWRGGHRPRIEEYLDLAEPYLRTTLLRDLLIIEIELRKQAQDEPSPGEYRERFPDAGAIIDDIFTGRIRCSTRPDGTQPGEIVTGCGDLAPTEHAPSLDAPTVDLPDRALAGAPVEPGLPERFGRYRVVGKAGAGACGVVYRAWDEELGRPVAVKVPHRELVGSPGRVHAILSEARAAAQLNRHGIVRVYDVGRHREDQVFVVFEFIDGQKLSDWMQANRLTHSEIARLMATVAEAVHHAHAAGLFHCDLKPSNILIDKLGQPYITDFGLAIREDLQHLRTGLIAGTPSYMAPEQVRGETHRVDRRTDVWALGVILYQALVQHVPFNGATPQAIFHEVQYRDARRPRQVDDRIPKELERICMKCLSRRMSDRYDTAAEFAADLRTWLMSDVSTQAPVVRLLPDHESTRMPIQPIVSKGLRAFDMEDAEFFLGLVPGPRDRDGLPESIRMWKSRIEARDASRTFPVGLLYGPSGCGKSSLVRAGLLPRLSGSLRSIYVEASALGTESRILSALRREFPDLPADIALDELTAALREDSTLRGGAKVLLVIDQFEQWLHAHPDEKDGELIRALRHCDGLGWQALLLVRDDFWMAVSRFLRALEVRPIEGVNCAAVELFEARHARLVLTQLGRALGKFEDWPETADDGERGRFLDVAIRELAGPDGRVIPVRLTLFAEMLRHRPWTTATLRELGGIEGVGVTFLEETFSARTAPLSHRAHQKAAQGVLKALLPDPTSDLKGRLQPTRVLRAVSGYADRPHEFDELLALLDGELRMITPVDPLAAEAEGVEPAGPEESYYQLTHDYLVPRLRQWLTRKQGETRQGRAEILLSTTATLWKARPDRRRLPGLLEWLKILVHTDPGRWSPDERAMMRRASRHYAVGAFTAAALLGMLAYYASIVRERYAGESLLLRVVNADSRGLAMLLPELGPYLDAVRPRLRELVRDPDTPVHSKEVAEVLLFRESPTPENAAELRRLALDASPDDVLLIRDGLASHADLAGKEELERIILDETSPPLARLRAACTLVPMEPGAVDRWKSAAGALVTALLDEETRSRQVWTDLLRPATDLLIGPLGEICCDHRAELARRIHSAEILADIVRPGPQVIQLARYCLETTHRPAELLLQRLIALGPSEDLCRYLQGIVDEPIRDRPREGVSGFGLRLMLALTDKDKIPRAGRNEVVVALVKGALHLRIFDSEGKKVQDVDESQLADRAGPIADLKWLLTTLRPKDLGGSERSRVVAEVLSILGYSSLADRLVARKAQAAIALARLGRLDHFWPLLRPSPDPRLRAALIKGLAKGALPHETLVDRLSFPETDPVERQAILLALADSSENFHSPRTGIVTEKARALFETDPSAAVHSAAELLLRRWTKREVPPPRANPGPISSALESLPRWEVGPNGHTFVILPGPLAFRMGARPFEKGYMGDQVLHYRSIERSIAVSTTEVTIEQFQRFDPSYRPDHRFARSPRCPALGVTWLQAVKYCLWLDSQPVNGKQRDAEEIERNHCYPLDVGRGMEIQDDALKKTGFRLPTEAEWEYLCRAGTESAHPFGDSFETLSSHAWTWLNADNHVHPVGGLWPNVFGLFDALGNVWEWCHDGPAGAFGEVHMPAYPPGTKEHPAGDPGRRVVIGPSPRGRMTWRVLRGGAFSYSPERARSGHRDWASVEEESEWTGFRVVRTLPEP